MTESKAHSPISVTPLHQIRSRIYWKARHRTSTGAKETHLVEDFLESALGFYDCYGFLYGLGMDPPWPDDLLRFVFIHISMRAVCITGLTTTPNCAFMKQVAHNLTDVSDGFLSNKECLIMDRDTKYTDAFRGHLKREGVKSVLCPIRAPNCNAFAERFVRSI